MRRQAPKFQRLFSPGQTRRALAGDRRPQTRPLGGRLPRPHLHKKSLP